jgi:hypothetical protein
MMQWKRYSTVTAVSVLAAAAAVTFLPTGVATADVCASAGRRIQVGGCANIADAVAPYAPPPAYYAPMPDDPPPPPNVTGCVSYNGRWVNAGRCN